MELPYGYIRLKNGLGQLYLSHVKKGIKYNCPFVLGNLRWTTWEIRGKSGKSEIWGHHTHFLAGELCGKNASNPSASGEISPALKGRVKSGDTILSNLGTPY